MMGIKVDVKYRKATGNRKQSDVDAECLSNAMRKMKKAMDKSGLMKEVRRHEYYEKPSDQRRRRKAREIANARKARKQEENENAW